MKLWTQGVDCRASEHGEARPHLLGLLAGLFLAAGLVISSMLVTRAWMRIAETETITVTGSARRNVSSDLMVWRGSFSVTGGGLNSAQQELQRARRLVEEFLTQQGVTNGLFGSIAIVELTAQDRQQSDASETTRQKTVGYRLTQTVEARLENLDQGLKVERQSTDLVERGVLFTPAAPEYIYTKAGEAKVDMLAEATKDARLRAEQIATPGGRGIGTLKSARMGVFQITPLFSTQVSWEGMNDVTSREKTVTAVVTATFSLN